MGDSRRQKGFFIVALILLLIIIAALFWVFFARRGAPGAEAGQTASEAGRVETPAYYNAGDFGIETLESPRDENENGVDDYRDILLGARQDAENEPRYDGAYHEGGYPPDDVGVCTDLVWRAFDHAGYDLKALVDADIAANPQEYPLGQAGPDPNIDFRRVRNLSVFFKRHCEALTLDTGAIAEWQPGDIVVFEGDSDHIGILSDRRNAEGLPWLIHNAGQPQREEDALQRWVGRGITGHYRWTPRGG